MKKKLIIAALVLGFIASLILACTIDDLIGLKINLLFFIPAYICTWEFGKKTGLIDNN